MVDVAKYKHFVPWVLDSQILTSTANLLDAELTIGYKFLRESYISTVSFDSPRFVKVSSFLF